MLLRGVGGTFLKGGLPGGDRDLYGRRISSEQWVNSYKNKGMKKSLLESQVEKEQKVFLHDADWGEKDLSVIRSLHGKWHEVYRIQASGK